METKPLVLVLDFDNTVYTKASGKACIEELEDRINLSTLKSILDRINSPFNGIKKFFGKNYLTQGLEDIKNYFEENNRIEDFNKIEKYLTKTKNYNKIFQNFDYQNIKQNNSETLEVTKLIAEAYTKIMGVNHRCYGPNNKKGFDIPVQTIAENYRKFATIDYIGAESNTFIKMIIDEAIENGQKIIIYTDNSKENIKSGLKALNLEKELGNVDIFDMFDAGGNTKKTKVGVENFLKFLKTKNINKTDIVFYDDSEGVLKNMADNFGIKSYLVADKGGKQWNVKVNMCPGKQNWVKSLVKDIQTKNGEKGNSINIA
jgi:FMN phosphatase YigB (HAD superfamily)